ncbi:MAG: hypothetical protein OYH76_19940 [Defluviicoccus sp.]|nr:hypothetical protein [Defluviicoccus sp.]MDE0278174.1 hypothetical protein [Defluviicoccus sp.]
MADAHRRGSLECEMTMVTEFGRYRAGMAGLLDEAVREVGKTEEWLDVAVNGDKASPQAVLKEDPMGAYRPYCALLLHKARLHMVAMLRANERNSIHSLAVQMRPILECAGQVVHIFHKLMVEPNREAGSRAVLEYANADYYQSIIGLTKGDVGHAQLLKTILEASTMWAMNVQRFRRLRQTNKVAMLQGGEAWYRFLSDRFCHGKADLRGPAWRGGVGSIGSWDDFTFAGFMDYLVGQAAIMNLYATLCPLDGVVAKERIEASQARLEQVRAASRSLRNGAVSEIEKLRKGSQDE